MHLKKQLYTLKIDKDGDIKIHFNIFRQCVSKLLQVDVKIQDENQAMILLSSLSDLYDILLSSLLKENFILMMDKMLTTMLKIDNKKQLTSSLSYRNCLITDDDSRDIQLEMETGSRLVQDVTLSVSIIIKKGNIKRHYK